MRPPGFFAPRFRGENSQRRDSVRCDGSVFCMSGPNAAKAAAAYAQTRHRTLKRDDTVMIHCNSYVDGFWTDVTRAPTVFGPPDEQQQKMRAAVLAAREAAFACVKAWRARRGIGRSIAKNNHELRVG